MEKTLARAIYKKMVLGKKYSAKQLRELVGSDFSKYNPGSSSDEVVEEVMKPVVSSGYATIVSIPEHRLVGFNNFSYYGGCSGRSQPIYRTIFTNYYVRAK